MVARPVPVARKAGPARQPYQGIRIVTISRPHDGTARPGAAAAVLLAGCGTAGSASPSSAQAAPAAQAAPGEHGAAAPAAAPAAARAGSSGAGQPASLTLATQDIIYTASLTVQARGGNVAAAVARATAIVAAAGGYTASEQEVIPPRQRALSYATLQLKI